MMVYSATITVGYSACTGTPARNRRRRQARAVRNGFMVSEFPFEYLYKRTGSVIRVVNRAYTGTGRPHARWAKPHAVFLHTCTGKLRYAGICPYRPASYRWISSATSLWRRNPGVHGESYRMRNGRPVVIIPSFPSPSRNRDVAASTSSGDAYPENRRTAISRSGTVTIRTRLSSGSGVSSLFVPAGSTNDIDPASETTGAVMGIFCDVMTGAVIGIFSRGLLPPEI